MNDNDDEKYMRRALELAKLGKGLVNPNPQVGAVIVKNGKIIGEGYHEQYGGLHAERNAFKNLTESAEGATIYVTLEPCAHTGHQPPCFEAIIEHKIARVVIGHFDPNPLVSGKGIESMRAKGIIVDGPVLKKECEAINAIFFHYILTKTPYVMMKYAMTMDGKIATYTGASKWITGEVARQKVHEDRSRFMAIMVGSQTVIADNPELTSRIPEGKNPIRVICDSRLSIPIESKVVTTAPEIRTIIATCEQNPELQQVFLESGCEIIEVSERSGHLDLQELMVKLGELNIDSVYLEGGATLNAAAFEARIVQKVQTYIAPKIFGGQGAKSPVGGQGVELPAQAYLLQNATITSLGEDILIECEVK
ncbi:MAG: bifunctional diaminohydroxyphosphoribosylaminopyrimidine deaminase/5-amino-6-(5-phosphoribosylamino)uracil reductase RibD [Lactococcus sp.]